MIAKSEWDESLRIFRRRGGDTIKMTRKEIGWQNVDWINVAQDKNPRRYVVNTLMNYKIREILLAEHIISFKKSLLRK